MAASLYNGLEPAARAAYPQIGQMQAALLAAGALGAVMSGSGPDGLRRRALVGAGAADPGAGGAGLVGVLGGADAARPGSDPAVRAR